METPSRLGGVISALLLVLGPISIAVGLAEVVFGNQEDGGVLVFVGILGIIIRRYWY